MNFYLQLKLAQLNKISFLKVQRAVFQQILQYLIQCNNQIILKDIKRVGSKTFPTKLFVLNFQNTSFSFLKPITVKVNLTIGKTQHSFMRPGIIPEISMNFGRQQPLTVLYSTLQHQVLHVIQFAIRQYRRNVLKHKIYPSGGLGGLIKKQHRDYRYDDNGILINQDGKQIGKNRTQHTLRPVQHYTDLNSIVRALQLFYIFNKNIYPNKVKLIKDFFDNKIYFLNHYFGMLQQYKSVNKDLYLQNLKKVYDQFINKPWQFTQQQILQQNNKHKQLLNQRNNKTDEKLQKKYQESYSNVVAHSNTGEDITESDFYKLKGTIFQFDAFDLSNLQDQNTSFALRIIQNLPYIRQKHDRYGDNRIIMSLPDGFNSLVKFLLKARALRQRQTQLDINGNKNIDNLIKKVTRDICVQVAYYKRVPNYTSYFNIQQLLQKYYY